jgi:hypothetical protein
VTRVVSALCSLQPFPPILLRALPQPSIRPPPTAYSNSYNNSPLSDNQFANLDNLSAQHRWRLQLWPACHHPTTVRSECVMCHASAPEWGTPRLPEIHITAQGAVSQSSSARRTWTTMASPWQMLRREYAYRKATHTWSHDSTGPSPSCISWHATRCRTFSPRPDMQHEVIGLLSPILLPTITHMNSMLILVHVWLKVHKVIKVAKESQIFTVKSVHVDSKSC